MNDPRPPHERGTSGEVFVFFFVPIICFVMALMWLGDKLSK